MPRVLVRRLTLLEPALIFIGIMAYIWSLRFVYAWFWIALLALVVISHCVRRERAAQIGFRTSNLPDLLAEYSPMLAFLALLMVSAGLLCQTTRQIGFARGFCSWAIYLPWGIFQQYLMNGYFLARFDAALSRRTASLSTAALFAGAHTPNWFLMLVTLVLGYCASILYRRHKNLYFLGIAHGTIGFLLYLVVPDSIIHHLNVGPGLLR